MVKKDLTDVSVISMIKLRRITIIYILWQVVATLKKFPALLIVNVTYLFLIQTIEKKYTKYIKEIAGKRC